jgi:hypothetical protein
MPTDRRDRLGHVEMPVEKVDTFTLEREQLAQAESAIRGHDHKAPVAYVDGVGEIVDLRRGEEPRLFTFEAGEVETFGGIPGEPSVSDRGAQTLGEHLRGLRDRRWRESSGLAFGDPCAQRRAVQLRETRRHRASA